MALKRINLEPKAPDAPAALPDDSEALLVLRNEIDRKLNLGLDQLDMANELSLQYRRANDLYAEVLQDKQIPTNQKAQVLNTLSNVLKSITESSQVTFSIARQKKIEAATLAAVRDLPKEAKDKFFSMFKEFLGPDVE